jgi:hypothetical protein
MKPLAVRVMNILSTTFAIATLFIVCGTVIKVVKAVQCNKISKIANPGATFLKEFTTSPANFQNPEKAAQSFTEMAYELQILTKEM